MSIAAMTYVWEHAPVKGSQLLILLAIADSARDPDWVAWPSIKTLMNKTRMGERGIRYILRDLEDAHCIATEIEGSRAGTNLYRVLRREGQSLPPPDQWGHEDAPQRGKGRQNGGHEDAPNPLNESSLIQESDDEDEIAVVNPWDAVWRELAIYGVPDAKVFIRRFRRGPFLDPQATLEWAKMRLGIDVA